MSIKVMSYLWQSADVGGSELLVLLALADYADDDGCNIYPSMNTLAKKARLSPDQTRRVIHKLIADGKVELIEMGGWDGKRNRANEYRIVLEGTCNLQGPSMDARGGTRVDASTVLAPVQDQSSYNHHTQPTESDEPTQPASPQPLAQQFHALMVRLRDEKNKPAILQRIYALCFGEQDLPDYGYLGKAAKQVGGAGYLAQRMFECVTRPPNGDVIAYILGEHRNKQRRHAKIDTANSTSSWSELTSTVPDYMEQ